MRQVAIASAPPGIRQVAPEGREASPPQEPAAAGKPAPSRSGADSSNESCCWGWCKWRAEQKARANVLSDPEAQLHKDAEVVYCEILREACSRGSERCSEAWTGCRENMNNLPTCSEMTCSVPVNLSGIDFSFKAPTQPADFGAVVAQATSAGETAANAMGNAGASLGEAAASADISGAASTCDGGIVSSMCNGISGCFSGICQTIGQGLIGLGRLVCCVITLGKSES